MDELPDVLKKIISRKKLEVAQILKDKDKVAEYNNVEIASHMFYDAITQKDRINIIAEHKRTSPSNKRKGNLPFRMGSTAYQMAMFYAQGGAAAMSVLTDVAFEGKLEDIADARDGFDAYRVLPILRKDFIINPIQIYESRHYGADAVLLITAALDDAQLKDYIQITNELGMDALVESHTISELERSITAGAKIFGINNRNLHTFEEDINTITEILSNHQDIYPIVCESAIQTPEDIQIIQEANPNVLAYLIGTSLMKSPDPIQKLKEFQGITSN